MNRRDSDESVLLKKIPVKEMTADNIKTCILDIGEMINVLLRSAWPKLEALAVSWWLNLMCANKGLAVWDFALSDVALYQQDERGVCPGLSADVGTEFAA